MLEDALKQIQYDDTYTMSLTNTHVALMSIHLMILFPNLGKVMKASIPQPAKKNPMPTEKKLANANRFNLVNSILHIHLNILAPFGQPLLAITLGCSCLLALVDGSSRH